MAVKYDEKAIAAAQKAWHDQDLETFGKTDPELMAKRHKALLDLLVAHVPLIEEADT